MKMTLQCVRRIGYDDRNDTEQLATLESLFLGGNYLIAFANFKQASNAFAASSPLFPAFPPLR